MEKLSLWDREAKGQELYDKQSKCVWIIKVTPSSGKNYSATNISTGFSVTKDLIMTAAHVFDKGKQKIMACRLDEREFWHELKLEKHMEKKSWDIAILSFKEHAPADSTPFKFAENGFLSTSEPLFLIGHPNNIWGSFLIGHASFECIDDVDLPSLEDTMVCKDYEEDHLHSYEETRRYRLMGDISDYDTRHFHPLVPIIQVSGFHCQAGCSGGPIFMSNGALIGMQSVVLENSFDFGIHVSALKAFFDKVVEKKDGGERKTHKASTSLSR